MAFMLFSQDECILGSHLTKLKGIVVSFLGFGLLAIFVSN